MESLRGVSGIAETPEGYLVVCDDLPDMMLMDFAGITKEVIQISPRPLVWVDGRVPKKHKRDFEAIAEYKQGKETKLLVFGSGSKLPQRSYVVQATWQGGLKSAGEVQLEKFYAYLIETAKIDPQHLNIEGATVFDNKLALLNRGLNQVIWMDLKAFLAYLENPAKTNPPAVRVHTYQLPQIAGIHGGFSGACGDLRRNRIYFSMSCEDVSDWIADGPVLGSHIGWIARPTAADGGELHVLPVVGDDGQLLPIKIEAISLLPMVDSRVRMLACTDRDGEGNSEMFVLELRG
jgi:hypothetical protein